MWERQRTRPQTAGNRAIQRLVAPGTIQRHITPAASNALTSLSISLALMTGNAFGASAQVQQLGTDAAVAMGKVGVVEGGANPQMPVEAGEGAGVREEIQVPATAGM